MLQDKTVLVTGGTGSFGHSFTKYILEHEQPKKIILYSRDEYKQFLMSQEDVYAKHKSRVRFFIGDVRDEARLTRAMEGVDYVIHAAALKQVPACEYNPTEAIRTNVTGAENVINAALNCGVRRVVALSTDKAVNPVNLYGATKMVSDKLFIAANAYVGKKDINFSIVRYGNVAGSRGSIIPVFRDLIAQGVKELPVTDYRMTRFWISLPEGVQLVMRALATAKGGETFISKIPSFTVKDLAEAMQPGIATKEVGIRPGEKLHEVMITAEDAPFTREFDRHFIIYPQVTFNENQQFHDDGKRVPDGFVYSSGDNAEWMDVAEIRRRLPEAV
ncbi:MAG: UDP-N-acetylglucosamine 4,6-dehydratase (inverting) [Lachnospiraceae bacterium]|nr:UDP-N-acetylglucosamine 4,6-dehydratase (inverting) [Lachnospiraceae bacterium]